MNYELNEVFLIALDSAVSLEYKYKFAIYEKVKNIKTFSDKVKTAQDYVSAIALDNYTPLIRNIFNGEYVDFCISELSKSNTVAVTIASKAYPRLLKEIENPPLVLYARGDVSLLSGNNFSIVGSRKSLPLSISIAERYSKELIDAGFNLVTGIAEGVDVTVLNTALKNNGKVISVIAGGLNNVYPKSHQNVFDNVSKNGLVISESPNNVVPKPFMFPVRNRIIAGLSKGTLVVNGKLISGTLYTAESAMENGRDLFAVPYSIGVKSGEGTNDLIKRGAMLTDKPSDILEFYGLKSENAEKKQLSEKEKLVYSVIEDGIDQVEDIAKKLNLSVSEVTTLLSLMEIKKIVVKNGINAYSLSE